MIRVADLAAGMRVSGVVHACRVCSTLFIGRVDALFCSPRCKMAAHRAGKDRNDEH